MNDTAQTLFPTLRCADCEAMMRWLVDQVGFREHAVHRDPAGRIAHAEMALGPSILMLGPRRDDDPRARDGGGLPYVAVADPDALHDRLAAAGTRIEEPPTDRDYGSREFSCRDPEGGIWTFGTYRPAAG